MRISRKTKQIMQQAFLTPNTQPSHSVLHRTLSNCKYSKAKGVCGHRDKHILTKLSLDVILLVSPMSQVKPCRIRTLISSIFAWSKILLYPPTVDKRPYFLHRQCPCPWFSRDPHFLHALLSKYHTEPGLNNSFQHHTNAEQTHPKLRQPSCPTCRPTTLSETSSRRRFYAPQSHRDFRHPCRKEVLSTLSRSK